jgi:hypothetical protein
MVMHILKTSGWLARVLDVPWLSGVPSGRFPDQREPGAVLIKKSNRRGHGGERIYRNRAKL